MGEKYKRLVPTASSTVHMYCSALLLRDPTTELCMCVFKWNALNELNTPIDSNHPYELSLKMSNFHLFQSARSMTIRKNFSGVT